MNSERPEEVDITLEALQRLTPSHERLEAVSQRVRQRLRTSRQPGLFRRPAAWLAATACVAFAAGIAAGVLLLPTPAPVVRTRIVRVPVEKKVVVEVPVERIVEVPVRHVVRVAVERVVYRSVAGAPGAEEHPGARIWDTTEPLEEKTVIASLDLPPISSVTLVSDAEPPAAESAPRWRDWLSESAEEEMPR